MWCEADAPPEAPAAEAPLGLGARPHPSRCVDAAWPATERALVAAYVRRGFLESWELGYSWCRFRCGAAPREMGCAWLTDGRFVWPEGLAHYIEAHAVRPSAAFIAHVLRQRATAGVDRPQTDAAAAAAEVVSLQAPPSPSQKDCARTATHALRHAAEDAKPGRGMTAYMAVTLPTSSEGATATAIGVGNASCDDGSWPPLRNHLVYDHSAGTGVPMPAATREYLRRVSTLAL